MICFSLFSKSASARLTLLNGLILLILSHFFFIFNFSIVSFMFGDILGLLAFLSILSASTKTLKSISSNAYFSEHAGYPLVFWGMGSLFQAIVRLFVPQPISISFFSYLCPSAGSSQCASRKTHMNLRNLTNCSDFTLELLRLMRFHSNPRRSTFC